MKYLIASALCASATLLAPAAGQAKAAGDEPAKAVTVSAHYKGDLVGVRSSEGRGLRLLGNAELTIDSDLEKLAGWRSARAKLHFLGVHGGRPNDLAGTIQGVNNIEVARSAAKLYQIWVEQGFSGDRAALLVGMTDLNADFYHNEAAGLLIAPAFGIGSEISATGPNGPSIFPSTAMAARLRVSPTASSYLKAGLFNAKAGVIGDP